MQSICGLGVIISTNKKEIDGFKKKKEGNRCDSWLQAVIYVEITPQSARIVSPASIKRLEITLHQIIQNPTPMVLISH